MRSLSLLLGLTVLAEPLAAQHLVADSTVRHRAPSTPVIRVWEAVAIVGLTAGAAAIDQSVRDNAQEHRTEFRDHLSDFGNAFGTPYYVYPALVVGALAGKAFGSKPLFGISWRALQSTALAGASVLVLKSVIGRRRPEVSPDDAFDFGPFTFKDNSFPSGHTAIAFSLATSLAAETRDHWSDALFYAVATLTAFSRVNDDKHWLSDTALGAGMGIVSARLVRRWNRPFVAGPGVVAMRVSF